jgi:hypothetical protein
MGAQPAGPTRQMAAWKGYGGLANGSLPFHETNNGQEISHSPLAFDNQ